MKTKPRVYFTSNVFSVEELGSNVQISRTIRNEIQVLWNRLKSTAEVRILKERFPSSEQIEKDLKEFNPHIIGCHLSHHITSNMQQFSNLFAISTSTAGYNHIERLEADNILITHTPGVLHEAVADYTISLIMANLRNIIDLHNYVWDGLWTLEDKWDLDQDLSSVITNKTIGIIGMGEIGIELVKRLYPWGVKFIYYDIQKKESIEKQYPKIEFKENLKELFKEADIIRLHLPLNKHTENLIDKEFLMLMKENSLLINTARGGILNLNDFLYLLETGKAQINFSFDVFPQEPLDERILQRLKKIKELHPNIRMILMPHNASADADTRGKMVILFL
ncbi:MAG: NAD(P)-binding domain-containing protein, partial [Candidatus Lokiarchaeota archaeon]|nr:NAD(P)-binding domain-containing protein [Candidatus Lokiarchaeota archaeon]